MARAIMGKNGVEVAVLRGVDDDIAYAGLVALLFAQDCHTRAPYTPRPSAQHPSRI
jgi:RNA-binding protein YhbY